MEKEKKLDEILRKRNDELRSKILDIYQSTISFLNKSIKEGKGHIDIDNGKVQGKAQYYLVIETDFYKTELRIPYKFNLIYSNLDQPHLQIDVVYSNRILFGDGKKFYHVFDVVEQSKDNLHVNTYLSGDDHHVNGWEEILMGMIKERSTTENGKLLFLPNFRKTIR